MRDICKLRRLRLRRMMSVARSTTNRRSKPPTDSLRHDALTGIWNRAAIVEILQRELARATREGVPVGVIMADIDHFKRLNDTLGHLGGDAALGEVSRRLSLSLRPSDSIGRYGGEEFLIVVPKCDSLGLTAVAERMRQVIAEAEVATPAGQASITVSLGAAISEYASADSGSLIQRADEAFTGQNTTVEIASRFPQTHRATKSPRKAIAFATQPKQPESALQIQCPHRRAGSGPSFGNFPGINAPER
jgi:diguanylate cyclase (GGDEF)-like protein